MSLPPTLIANVHCPGGSCSTGPRICDPHTPLIVGGCGLRIRLGDLNVTCPSSFAVAGVPSHWIVISFFSSTCCRALRQELDGHRAGDAPVDRSRKCRQEAVLGTERTRIRDDRDLSVSRVR